MQQKRLGQRAAAAGERGRDNTVGVGATRRRFSRARQNQRPRHNHRPQAPRTGKRIFVFQS